MLSIIKLKKSTEKNDVPIIIFKHENEIWYKGTCLAELLGYQNHFDPIQRHVEHKNKIFYGEIKNKMKQINETTKINTSIAHNALFINKEGLTTLLMNSERPNVDKIAEQFDITTLYRYKRKEIEIIDELGIFFDEMEYEYKTQYYVDNYKIDMYIPFCKLAIEIDEFNHNDRNEVDETIRENYIKNKLNCKFIRVNPDDKNFNIFQLVAKIVKHIDFVKKSADEIVNAVDSNKSITDEYFKNTKDILIVNDDEILVEDFININKNEGKTKNDLFKYKKTTNVNFNSKRCSCGKFNSYNSTICKQCEQLIIYKKLVGNGEYHGIKPDYEQLKKDIKELPLTWIGKKYNVSDTCIKKWIKKFEKDKQNLKPNNQ